LFESESRIFKNEQILSPEYLPELLPHREHQIERIANNLSPTSKGRPAQNMFVFGIPGIGKTASIKFVFRELEEYSDRAQTVYINTWDYNTSHAILVRLVLDLGFFVQRRGLSKDEIIERLIEVLRKTKKGLVVCLDEVDQLIKKDENALYDLLRLNQYVDNPIGLVMVSNYRDIFVNVEPRIKSSLDVEEIEFKPYTLQEMKDVLMERCKAAFRSGVLEKGVILLCANHAVNKGGDVRIGLECLRKAARVCEEEDSDKVKVDHVKKVLKQTGPVKLKMMREKLDGVEKNIVELLSDEKEITSTELYNKYVDKFGKISQFGLRKHIKHLEDIGMLRTKKSRRETRGRKYFISLVKRKSFK
jgi:cell division control protein 6